ncbi:lipopolysaccharide assembly protein LapA domain-containing protein [Shewanella mesophila]|uniref:LapA family protein n=1 Tax=Shewanella mesophila TaxID=2864208 RepID=UPI001C65B17B|nr:lipopolysaccharide assembly protein LapA domain-containing protein [Shewanella mesophila]QYJ87828.1 lipopolysaccharide assembly protein LapA domain-containing protein [Shewanella mesophila]
MKSFIATVLVALFFVLALLFGARNEQLVTISYFVAQGEYRLPVVLGAVFLAGFLVSWLFAIYHISKMKLVVRQANKKIAQLETKLSPLVPTTQSALVDSNAKERNA